MYQNKCLDTVPLDADLHVRVFIELQQQVNHVLRHKAITLAPTTLDVLVQHVFEEPVHHPAEPLRPTNVPL